MTTQAQRNETGSAEETWPIPPSATKPDRETETAPPENAKPAPLPESRAVIRFTPAGAPSVGGPRDEAPPIEPDLQAIRDAYNVRYISPRNMADLALELYVAGYLSWEEYAALAFQPELQPAYNRTVGALTGRKAEPDRPRDYILLWERRLVFERKYNAKNRSLIEATRRILGVLRILERPVKLVS